MTRPRRRPAPHLRGAAVRALAAWLMVALVAACDSGAVVPPPQDVGVAGPPSVSPASSAAPSAAAVDPGADAPPSMSPLPSTASPSPTAGARYDPAKFGFAAKGLRGEVMAFVTTSQVDDALARLDFSSVSTISFFSLEASSAGAIRHDGRWRIWTSPDTDELIERAHASGTRVVISLARFSWSPKQTTTSTALLTSPAARARLAREVADEVVRRGVDGVNVDFEPIPRGQKANFTDVVRRIRAELDARGPGYQLTFDVVGHFDSYDVGGALRPGGADAVYLMGYHYAGTFSTIAHGTAPLGGPRYSVGDAIRGLRKVARPEQIIVGVPYYGHLWPTASGALNARTTGRGYDLTYDRARRIAQRHPTSYDRAEQVRVVAWRERSCATCPLHWIQLYFDDTRSLGAKWAEFQRQGLLGTGIWTSAFEGLSGDLTTALKEAWLVDP
jgi:spore germination protein YaaH